MAALNLFPGLSEEVRCIMHEGEHSRNKTGELTAAWEGPVYLTAIGEASAAGLALTFLALHKPR